MMEPEGDEEDYYVAYDEVGTTSSPSSGPGYWPLLVLDGLACQSQPLVSSHPPTTIRSSSGSSHTSLELPSTPINSGSSDSSSSSDVEIEVSH